MISIHWTQEARRTLKNIEHYLSDIQHAPLIASDVIKQITGRVEQLYTALHSGRMVPDYQDRQVRELLEKPYRIIYLVISDTRIDILSVMHYRQLLPNKTTLLSAAQAS